jgi:arylformamidase
MAVYGDDPPPALDVVHDRPAGAAQGWRVSALRCSVHAGTHVDAPAHLFAGGATVDQIPAARLCGQAVVLDCRRATAARRMIEPADLQCAWGLAGKIVLLRQGLARELAAGRQPSEHRGLSRAAAERLVGAGVQMVGVEALSVDGPPDEGGACDEAHRALLGAGVPVVEALDLEDVSAGQYWAHIAPLRLAGAEAAPCRAWLWPDGGPARRREEPSRT